MGNSSRYITLCSRTYTASKFSGNEEQLDLEHGAPLLRKLSLAKRSLAHLLPMNDERVAVLTPSKLKMKSTAVYMLHL